MTEVKKCLNGGDMEPLHKNLGKDISVKKAKEHLADKKLFRMISTQLQVLNGNMAPSTLVSVKEFQQLVKIFCPKEISETGCTDLFCLLTKRKDPPAGARGAAQGADPAEDLNATRGRRGRGGKSMDISVELGQGGGRPTVGRLGSTMGKKTSLVPEIAHFEETFKIPDSDARMEIGVLDAKLENFVKTQDNMSSFLN